jgi:hypothetical protein
MWNMIPPLDTTISWFDIGGAFSVLYVVHAYASLYNREKLCLNKLYL